MSWFRFEQQDEKTAKLFIDDIVGLEPTAKEFRNQLAQQGEVEQINLELNSPGGDVIDGWAIYNALVEHPAQVHTKINGWAASMASIIAMAGDTVEMPTNSWFMIHNPWTLAAGESDDLRSMADVMDSMKGHAVRAYQRHIDADADTISGWMDEETWFNGEDAQGLGWQFQFTDPLEVSASVSRYLDDEKVPADAKEWLKRAEEELPGAEETEQTEEQESEKSEQAAETEQEGTEDVSEEPEQGQEGIEASGEYNFASMRAAYEAGQEAGRTERQPEIDERDDKITELKQEADAAQRDKQSAEDRLSKLIGGTSAPPLEGGAPETWQQAVDECDGDYVQARRRFPELYRQKREADKQKRQTKIEE